jgi:hypothetical protein
MTVREATVGPLSGTWSVSLASTTTKSAGTPSPSPTSWANAVSVPCPISVFAESTRGRPSGAMSSAARDDSLTSPLPVNPAPW